MQKSIKLLMTFFLIINLNSMHPFMDHILKLNTGQGSIYSNSQIINLLIYLSTFSLKIFFSNIVQLSAMFHYTKESDSMILLKQVLHFTKVSRLLSKSNFLFSCMVQLTRNTLSYSNLTQVREAQTY